MRRSILAMVMLTLSLTPSSAQTLKQQLVGTWLFVSSETTNITTGKVEKLAPSQAHGIIIFDAGGRYADLGGRSDRAKFKTPGQPTTEELATAMRSFVANFGTWTVNEADKTVTRHFEGALNPGNEGNDVKGTVNIVGDELNMVQTFPILKINATFRRATPLQ